PAVVTTGAPVEEPRPEETHDAGPAPSDPVVSGRVEPAPLESLRDDVEEVVVEQALAAGRERSSAVAPVAAEAAPAPAVARNGAAASVAAPAPAAADRLAEPLGSAEPVEALDTGRPARRRGRVTRSGGAPVASAGDAPVAAVLTVAARPVEAPVAPAPSAGPATDTPASAGEPTVPAAAQTAETAEVPAAPAAPRRRPRRAASRPAGPPVAGGDPV
ncbi:MAG TPA: hypothetical protein VF667_04740, partial [Pseudonocardia sp.]